MDLHCVVANGLNNVRSVDNLGYVEKTSIEWCGALKDRTSREGEIVL